MMNACRPLLLLAALLVAPASSATLKSPSASAVATPSSSWRSASDPTSGRTYYWHLETRERQWERPAELDAAPAAATTAPATAETVAAETAAAAQPAGLIAWKGPSESLPARLGRRAREAVAGGASALGGLGGIVPQGSAFVKGVYLSSVLAFAAVVI